MRRWILIIPVFLVVLLLACLWRRSNNDEIRLEGNTGSHNAAIVLNGRRAGCFDDEIARAKDKTRLSNVLSPAACSSRIGVLVQDRAMYWADSISQWTDGAGDSLKVPLESMPQLPVALWVPLGGSGDATVHFVAAAATYNDMQCGIGFPDTVGPVENGVLGPMSASCANLGPVKSVGYSVGHLNVYYVDEVTDAFDARGIRCQTDPNVILISANLGVVATLAHEIGHALTLDHTNNVDGLNQYTELPDGTFICNLMLQSGVNQQLLSTGQCFRTNLNSLSAINTLGARTGPMPECDPVNRTAACPPLACDVAPK
jgi:hypothetical protein